MRNRSFLQRVLIGLLLLTAAVIGNLMLSSVAMAQGPAPFLVTPYYGTKNITSHYDHTFPLNQNQNVRYFDGRLGITANCDPSFNRAYATAIGECLYYDGHEGVDFATGYGPILAAASGTVTQRGWNNVNNRGAGYGLYVDVQHVISVGGQNVVYTTRYGHLSAIAVSVNQVVQAGQIIGSSGSTGNSSGAHLHFGVLNQNNQNTDPFGWTGGGADPSGTGSTCLWTDGEWAGYCGGMRRPIPEPVSGGVTQLDDNPGNNNGFAKGNGGYPNNICQNNCANWTLDNNMYYTFVNGTTPNSWARWLPTVLTSGAVYEIQVFIPNVPANTTTWQAPYTIVHSDGTTNAVIDQEGSRDKWISIGSYRMLPGSSHGVYVTDASGETAGTRRVGADAVRFIRRGTTYAPDVRSNNNSWSSGVTIRNNGAGEAKLMIRFLQQNGTNACLPLLTTLPAHGANGYNCGPTNWASTIVDSTQDVSVLVRQERGGIYTHEAYPGIDNPTADVRVPIVQRNNSGWYSDLFVQNAGTTNTDINLEFFGAAGGCILTSCPYNNQANLAPGARAHFVISTTYTVNGFYGAVRVTNSNNQPLAVASTQYFFNGTTSLMMETSNTQPPASVLYGPLIQYNNGGWSSGLATYRLGGSSVTTSFYPQVNNNPCHQFASVTNNPWTQYPAIPGGTTCPTTPLTQFVANGGTSMVANVNQLQPGTSATNYAAIANPSQQVIVSKVWRGAADNTGWSDGFVIANYNNASTNVTVRFYNAGDGAVYSTVGYNIGALQNQIILGAVPTNFTGSAVIISDRPIAVMANSYRPGSGVTRDIIGSYPATHR